MKKLIVYTLSLTLLFCSCAVVKSPPQYYIKKEAVSYDPYGSWMNIEFKNEEDVLTIYGGELLAMTKDSVLLLDLKSNLLSVPKSSILRTTILIHQDGVSQVVNWAVTGFTIGVIGVPFMIFTVPAWLIVGTKSIIAEIKTKNYRKLGQHSWEEMEKFSRYPQGLPPTIDISKLTAKPFGESYELQY